MKRKTTDTISIIVFLLPALILFFGILVLPMVLSGYYSLFEWNGVGDMKFINFGNFKEMFTSDLVPMKAGLLHALLLAGLSVGIQLPLSLGLALMLGRGIKGERFFLSINFLPVLISTVVIGKLWSAIYTPKGMLNNLLRSLGIIGEKNILWTNDGKNGKLLLACIIPMLWQYVGYHMLLMYAGVKSVAPELREAAKIDGATTWQVDRHVVIPSMKQVLKVSVIFAVTGSLKAYDLISILGGNKNSSAAVPSTLLMNQMFDANRVGMGSAIAVVMIILCFAFAVLINFLFRERD